MIAPRAHTASTSIRPAARLSRVLFFAALVALCFAGSVAVAFAAPTTTAVVTTLSPDGANGWYITTPTVALVASEPGTTYYSLSSASGPWTTYSTPVVIPEGVNTLYYYSSDTLGNDEAVVSLQLRVDTVVPAVTVSGVDPGGLYNTARIPTFSAADANLDAVSATLDGDAFTSGSSVATDGAHTLVVGASDLAGNATTTSVTFTIDSTPPTITVSGVDAGPYKAAVTPIFSAADSDLATVTATLDGAAFASGSSVATEGAHTLVVSASDTAGNASTATATFTIDLTPPAITIAGVAPGGLYAAAVTPIFSATDSDLSTVTATLDGEAFASGSSVATEGAHTLVVSASDTAGNASTATATFTIDASAPVITVTGVTDGGLYNTARTPAFSATDSDLSTVTATLDGVPFASGSSVATEGAHTLVVSASDTAGNTATDTRTFTIDSTPPTVSAAATPASPDGLAGWYTTAPQVALSASEPATISYSTTSQTGPFTDYTAPLAFTDGANTLHYRATDTAGNTSAVSSLTLDVDTSAPSKPAGVTVGGAGPTSLQLTWDAVVDAQSGLAYYRLYRDGSVLATSTTTTYTAAGLSNETTYSFEIQAIDVAGNSSPRSDPATGKTLPAPDTAPPVTTAVVTTLSPDGANGWYITTPTVALVASEPGTTYYSLSSASGPWTTYSTPVVIPEGVNTLYYYSSDTLGNDEAVVSLQLRVDTVVPAVTVSGVDPGGLYNTARIPTFSAADANLDAVSATLDGDAFTSGSSVATDGAHTLVVGASDLAGNATTTSVTFTIDSTPPTITVSGVDAGPYKAAVTPIFSAADSDLATVTATLDGAAFASGSSVATEGAHTLVVSASDTAGNASTATATFTIDLTPPAITIAGVAPGGLYAAAVTPIFSATDSDLSTVTATLDGEAFASGSSVATEGAHTLVVSASDTAGNASTATASLHHRRLGAGHHRHRCHRRRPVQHGADPGLLGDRLRPVHRDRHAGRSTVRKRLVGGDRGRAHARGERERHRRQHRNRHPHLHHRFHAAHGECGCHTRLA